MKIKNIITLALLVFVAASIITLVIKQQKPGSGALIEQQNSNIVVYYFHGNKRCATCKSIEAFAKEAINSQFANELENGTMTFKSINVELPGNEHFVQDYQLTFKTVVVARYVDGEQVEWKNMERVWELVPDKPVYMEYIESETRKIMENA